MDRVLVAMSGGIDSSISAYLLQKEGYEVIGITFVNYIENPDDPSELQFVNDAKLVADFLGIKHIVIDIQEDFKAIVEYFVKEYFNGRTPNPCVFCNPTIKWRVFVEHADLLGVNYIATGHYALKKYENGRYFISKGKDITKDQSYFLYRLPQSYLQRTLFPLGQYTKDEIRRMAGDLGLHRLVQKRESYDVCFIKNQDYRDFLKKYAEKNNIEIKPGKIVDVNGNVVGRHDGLAFYTIGQRRGLGVAMGYPAYVKDIDVQNNTIVIAPREELAKNEITVKDWVLMKYEALPEQGLKVQVKIRYRDNGTPALIKPEGDIIRVYFSSPAYGITPGQSAVFYEGDDVVGGGVIA